MLSRSSTVLLSTALIIGSTATQAASISFSESSITANLNDTVSVDILMDFSGDPVLGGGFDIFYDASILAFDSFDFSSSTLTLDLALSRVPDEIAPNKLEGLAFSEGFFGGTGPGVVGTLNFTAIANGDLTLTMADTTNPLGGGRFISAVDFLSAVDVNYGSANVSVGASAVPVPAAAWLFGSGLLGLAGVATRRKQHND